jgi:SNF2 family DNA or RNA helicase
MSGVVVHNLHQVVEVKGGDYTPAGYTLNDYFRDAGVQADIQFAKYVTLKFKPRQDQITDLSYCLKHNRFGLYNSPGCGKSIIAQAYASYWISEGERVIAFMPPILLEQFRQSFHDNLKGIERYLDVQVYAGTTQQRKKLYDSWKGDRKPQIILLSNDIFRSEYNLFEKDYRVVIADEAHSLKSPTSTIYKAVHKYLGGPTDSAFLPMTGSPIKNELKDAYGLISLTNPGAYVSYGQFEKKHFIYTNIYTGTPRMVRTPFGLKQTNKVRVHSGYKNEDSIGEHLYKYARRTLKEDVVDLKEPTVIRLPVTLSREHKALYKKLKDQRLLEIDGEIVNAIQAQALRQKLLQIVTCPELFVEEGTTIKNNMYEALWQVIDTVNLKETKLLVFANLRQSVKAIANELKDLNPVILNGEISDKERSENKRRFIEDDTCRVCVANPDSAGVGVDGFQYVCFNAMFLEPTGVPGTFLQAMDRLYRTGQTKSVNVWVAEALGTISPAAIDNMMRKEGDNQEVLLDRRSLILQIEGGE